MSPTEAFESIAVPSIRVTREVPLWGILTMLLAVAGGGVSSYYAQQRQGEELGRISSRQVDMATDLRTISNKSQETTLKYMEMTFQITTLEQRIRLLETARTPNGK